MKFLRIAVLAIAGMTAAAPAVGEKAPTYRMVWNILPQGEVGKTRLIADGAEVVELKLTPPALYRVPADVYDERGKILLPEGVQLVGLQSDVRMACTINPISKSGPKAILFTGGVKRICLIDQDGDGRFESKYLLSANEVYFYFRLSGRLPVSRKSIAPIELDSLSPEEIEYGPLITIYLRHGDKPDQPVEMAATVGSFDLFPNYRVDLADLPQDFQLYGGAIRIARSTDGRFEASIIKEFDSRELDFWN